MARPRSTVATIASAATVARVARPARARASTRLAPPPPVTTPAKIHGRGEARLDRVLEFVAFVAKPMPLPLLLDEAPRRIAEIVGADVASLYLLEGEGE